MTPGTAQASNVQTSHASSVTSAPVIGVVDTRSGASFAPVLAPASLGVIFGDPQQSPLAIQSSAAENGTLPYELAGVSVTFGGQAAQLVSVSPARINFVVPQGFTSGEAEVIVTLKEGYLSLGKASVIPTAPALFTADGSGAGDALVLNAATYMRGAFDVTTDQNLSVDKRTRLIMYATGLSGGLANTNATNDVKSGTKTITNLSESVLVEARTLDGRVYQLPVEFAGANGPIAGLDQLNIVLVEQLRGAGSVALTIIANGQRSNAATVTVR